MQLEDIERGRSIFFPRRDPRTESAPDCPAISVRQQKISRKSRKWTEPQGGWGSLRYNFLYMLLIIIINIMHINNNRALRRPRRAAANNLGAPPPTFGDRRAAAASDILLARPTYAILSVFIFSMTKKRSSET